MIKSDRHSRSDSHTGFVLIRGSTGQEQRTSWEWLTQRKFRMQEDQG